MKYRLSISVIKFLNHYFNNKSDISKEDLHQHTLFLLIGMDDGWILTNKEEYQAVKWINKNIDPSMEYLNTLNRRC